MSRPASAIPTTMNFQGRLADASGAIVPDGLYNMQFKLYTASSGGSPVWSETRETTNRVQVTNGLFTTKLGEVSAISASLFASGNLYFEITLATPGTATCSTASCATWESAMTPRHQMSTSAYAFNSDTLDGLDSTAFAAASGSANYIQNGSSPQTANFNITGTGTAATLQAATFDRATSGTLTIGGTASSISLVDNTVLGAGLSFTLTGGNTASRPGSPTDGMMYYDTDTKQLMVYNSTTAKWQADRSDAVLVAASDSSATDKAAADYLADGNTASANDGDQVQINSALTAGSGKKVVLLAGTYTLDAGISVPNSTTLAGVGNGTVLTLPNSFNASINMITNTDQTTGTAMTVRDLKIDGNKTNQSSGTMRGIRTNFMGGGSGTTTRKGAYINNVYITELNSNPVTLVASHFSTVNNVVAQNNTGAFDLSSSTRVNVQNSTFTSATATVIVNILSSSYSTFTGNVIRSDANAGTGLMVDATSSATFSNNIITDSATGIELKNTSAKNTVAGNTIETATVGVRIETGSNNNYNLIENNSITSDTGIQLSAPASYNLVKGNTISNSVTAGIYLYNNVQNTVEGNVINNPGGAATNSGIVIEDADNATIINNTLLDTSCTTNCYAIDVQTGGSVSNYLSGNVFSTSSGTATIRDLGTTTIFANQTRTQSGLDTLFKQAASATAFQIQNASGSALLTADSNSTNNRIQIGSSTTDATAIFFMLDSYNNGTDPTGVNGAMYYNTSLNKYRCYQNGAWTDCITTDTIGANTTLSNLGSTNINAALNTTAGNLTLQTTTSGNIIINAAGTTELQDDTNVGGNLTLAANKTLNLTGGTTASRPGSPTDGMVYYDTDTKQLLVYNASLTKWQADSKTAKFIVAATNSSQAVKDGAQYVANGEDSAGAGIGTLDGDQVQINAALTAASSAGGGIVFLAEGTYTVDGSISVPNNVILAGSGNNTLIQYGNFGNANLTLKMITNSDTSTGTGVTIRDMRLDGRKTVNTVGTHDGVYLDGMGDSATARSGALVQNIKAENFRWTGVYLNNSDNTKVTDSTFTANSNGVYALNSAYLTINDNIAYSNSNSYRLFTTTDSTVGNNIANDGTGIGVYIANTSARITVTGNIIRNNTGSYGVYTNLSSSIIVTSNTIEANDTGVLLDSSTNNTVQNNTFVSNTAYGVLVSFGSNHIIQGNKMRDNGGATTNNAIDLYDSDSNFITGNTISDSSATTNNYAIYIETAGSDTNYLADNIFSSGTINDLGTGTIYANQTKTAGGLDTVFKQAASASAFQIQNATGVAQLTADTSNSRIQIGSGTTDATAIVFALDNYNQASDPSGVNGAMYFNTNWGVFRCYQNGWTDCIGANTTLSNLGSTNINAALNATSANLTLQTTTSGNIILNAAGTTELQDDTNVGGNLTIAASKYLKLTGGNTASRPGSPTDGMVYYDTDTKQLLTYANGKWQADSKMATFIVAASNSSQAVKDGAQYVANGEDSSGTGIGTLDGDQIEINNALSAASSAGGGLVYLAEGTYTIDAAISVPNNVTLAGSGSKTLVQLGNFGSTSVSIKAITNTDTSTGTGVTVRDLKLDGRKSINTVGLQHGIWYDNMGDTTSPRQGGIVTNVWVNNFKDAGISLQASDNSVVNNVVAYNNYYNIDVESSVNTTVTGSTVSASTHGIYIYGGNNITVTGNTASANTNSGIYVSSSKATVTGNNVDGAGTGIYIYSSNDVIASGNLVSNSTAGMRVEWSNDISVGTNRILTSGGATTNEALYLYEADRTQVTDNKITDTSCTTTCYAINIDNSGVDNTYLSGNTYNTGSIRDIGTNTIYANQSKTAGGLDALYKQANSTTAFQIQRSSGTALFTADTTNNNVTLGAGTSLTLTGGNTASRPASPTDGMVYYDTDTKQLLVYNGTTAKWQADRSEAVLVAASNSSAADKAAADYLADGDTGAAADGDQVQINSALTAGSGKKVVLLAGTYTIDATVLIPNNTTFAGVGGGTNIELANLAGATDNMVENSDTTTGTGVTIRDMTINGRKDLNTSGTQYGIHLNGMGDETATPDRTGATITNVKVINTRTIGLSMANSDVNTITGNTFKANRGDNVYLTTSNANIFSSNIASDSETANGFDMYDVERNTFTGNIARANASDGFYLDYLSDDNKLDANFVENNSLYGIYIYFSLRNLVSNNHISYTSNAAIYLDGANNNTLIGNSLNENGGANFNNAIYLAGSDSNTITSNSITDSAAATNNYAINVFNATSDNNYLSNNSFASGSINDAGTGTRYANQSKTAGGLDIAFKQTASTTAFQIQNASSAALLTADSSSTNNRIQIGSSSTDATAIFFMLDSYNNGTDPTGVNGAMYYNSNTNRFRCYEASAWADCVGANQSLSNLTTTSINQSLIANANNSIDIGSSGTAWRSGYFGTSLSTPALRPAADGTTAFKIQNAGGTIDYWTLDTTNSRILLGTSDTTGTLLVLDTKTGSGDPTGVNGGMYYNSNMSRFRCYEGGAWRNCTGSSSVNVSTASQSPTLGTDTYITGSSVPLAGGGMQGPTGSAQNGTLITWKVLLTKTAGTTAHTFTIRFGTAGTTADTARCTAFSTGTGTAVADAAVVTITAYATAGGSATTLNCSGTLTHTLSTTGFSTAQYVSAYSTQTSFDSSTAGTIAGLSLNSPTGSGAVIQNVQVTTTGL